MEIKVRVRGIIIHEGKLLVFKLRPTDDFYSLPGGKVESGENLESSMERELIEETGIKPEIGRVLCVQDLVLPEKEMHSVEFFFEIKNSADYLSLDIAKATHGYEISDHAFVDVNANTHKILPSFLKEMVNQINEKGIDNFEFRIFEGKES